MKKESPNSKEWKRREFLKLEERKEKKRKGKRGDLLEDLDEFLGLVESLYVVVGANELSVNEKERVDTALSADLPDLLALLSVDEVAVDDFGISLDEALDDIGHLKGLLGDKHAAGGAGVDDNALAHSRGKLNPEKKMKVPKKEKRKKEREKSEKKNK